MLHPESVVMRWTAPLETPQFESLFLCDIDTGEILALNVTARAIWEAIKHPITIKALCEILQCRFTVSEAECLQAVTETLGRFEQYKFARFASPTNPR
jgi:hypothetical protein